MCLIKLDLFDKRSNEISRIYFVSLRMFHVQTFILSIFKQLIIFFFSLTFVEKESNPPAGLTITVIFLLQVSKNVIREIWDYQRAGDYVAQDTNTKSCILDIIPQYSGIAGVSAWCFQVLFTFPSSRSVWRTKTFTFQDVCTMGFDWF